MSNKSKNIIICCDGTGNEYGINKTNVIRTCEIAQCDESQLVYYDPGVGTGGWGYGKGSGSFSLKSIVPFVRSRRDGAIGKGLQKNIEDAYRFLMKIYEPGDRVFLFGFSRGAFTARSLAGMLHYCGLLRRDLDNLVEYASKIYNRKDDNLDAGFKADFAHPCPVYFIGVWDTVASLSLTAGKKFHDARLNDDIKHAYHAVALDEMRKSFPPSLWDEKNVTLGQTMEQVWFAGVHSDVGGWYDERGLSDIALWWMMDKAQSCGMTVDEEKLAAVKGNPLGELHDSHSGIWTFMGKHKRQVSPGAKVHKSVKEKMSAGKYRPVKPLPDDVQWVE